MKCHLSNDRNESLKGLFSYSSFEGKHKTNFHLFALELLKLFESNINKHLQLEIVLAIFSWSSGAVFGRELSTTEEICYSRWTRADTLRDAYQRQSNLVASNENAKTVCLPHNESSFFSLFKMGWLLEASWNNRDWHQNRSSARFNALMLSLSIDNEDYDATCCSLMSRSAKAHLLPSINKKI